MGGAKMCACENKTNNVNEQMVGIQNDLTMVHRNEKGMSTRYDQAVDETAGANMHMSSLKI
jgi:hypothetical protein